MYWDVNICSRGSRACTDTCSPHPYGWVFYSHKVVLIIKNGDNMKIYTIGHSNHTKEEFLEMLHHAEIKSIADVRAFPYSKKHPQFNGDELKEWLREADISYEHFPHLGGRRGTSSIVGPTLNDGWDNQSFHNYADYTLSDDYKEGIKALTKKAKKQNVAYMCSESHPARCHRLLISNWLAAHGHDVCHIIHRAKGVELDTHQLGRWGAMPIIEEDHTVVYPELK